jgi:hypothetical protein
MSPVTINAPHRFDPMPASRLVRLAFLGSIIGALAVRAPVATADPGPAAQAEIDHLLRFVEASPCQFVRNGKAYPAAEARKHLDEKLRHARRRLATADDFVRGVATQSSISGEPYLLRCGDTEVPTGAWLYAELLRLRAAASGANAPSR